MLCNDRHRRECALSVCVLLSVCFVGVRADAQVFAHVKFPSRQMETWMVALCQEVQSTQCMRTLFCGICCISPSFSPLSYDSWTAILNPSCFVHHFVFILEADRVGFTPSVWRKFFTGHWIRFSLLMFADSRPTAENISSLPKIWRDVRQKSPVTVKNGQKGIIQKPEEELRIAHAHSIPSRQVLASFWKPSSLLTHFVSGLLAHCLLAWCSSWCSSCFFFFYSARRPGSPGQGVFLHLRGLLGW